MLHFGLRARTDIGSNIPKDTWSHGTEMGIDTDLCCIHKRNFKEHKLIKFNRVTLQRELLHRLFYRDICLYSCVKIVRSRSKEYSC